MHALTPPAFWSRTTETCHETLLLIVISAFTARDCAELSFGDSPENHFLQSDFVIGGTQGSGWFLDQGRPHQSHIEVGPSTHARSDWLPAHLLRARKCAYVVTGALNRKHKVHIILRDSTELEESTRKGSRGSIKKI